jgi:gliding motility-associated-like protein
MIRIITPLFLIPLCIAMSSGMMNATCPNPNASNLIINGDFGSGQEQTNPSIPVPVINTLLTYNFGPSPSTAKYTLINSTAGSNFNWIEIGDNSTDPEGYMMLINGYLSATKTYSYTLDVCEGSEYYIGLDVINMVKGSTVNYSDPNLELRVNGNPIVPAQVIGKETGWITLGANYIVPTGVSSIEISLFNYTGTINGNDFAIDNVTANLCGSDVLLTELTNAPYCPGDNLNLSATVSPNPGATLFYQLQTSLDGGLSWTNSGSPTNLNSFSINDLPYNTIVRVLVNTSLNGLNSESCSFVSQALVLTFDDPDNCFNTPISNPGVSCSGSLGNNIIPNGDFGSGLQQFAPFMNLLENSLVYADDGFLDEGEFTVANEWQGSPCFGNSAEICWLTSISNQNNEPDGYFQLVNGGTTNEIIWSEQVLGFCGELIHTISFDVLNLANDLYAPNNAANPEEVALPEIELVLSSIGESEELIKVISTPFSTGPILNDGQWRNFSFNFLGNNFQNNLKISLRLKGSSAIGNDFALDNISTQFCGPEIILSGPLSACENELITINANISNGLTNDFFFKWEKSLDGGNSWSLISGASSDELLVNAEEGAMYRVNTAYNEFNGIPSSDCFAISETFTLDVFDTGPFPISAVICPGDYYYIGTDSFNFEIFFTDTLTAFNGCDSIVDLTLQIENNLPTLITENICPSEEVEWDGMFLSEEGIYFDTLSSFLGCDSVLILSIIVEDSTLINEEIILCVGDTYNGISYDSDTILYKIFTNEQGCDSTIATNIKVSDLADFEIYGDPFICNDNTPTTTLFVDEYTKYKWSNGSIQQSAVFTQGGNYAVTVTDELNCQADKVFSIEMIELDMNVDVIDPLCHNDTTGIIEINEVLGGDMPYLYSIDSGSTVSSSPLFENVSPSTDSIMIFLIDDNGCIITQKVFVENPDLLILDLGNEEEINIGESINISAESNQDIFSIEWYPADSINCSGCLDISVTPILPYQISATITNEAGCKARDNYDINIGKRRNVYVPNIFTPNFDGENDYFYIQGGIDVVSISNLIVYDRWGNMVYQNADVLKNSQQNGWNGRFNGNLSPSGVYSYHFLVYFTDGKVRRYEGSITLMR